MQVNFWQRKPTDLEEGILFVYFEFIGAKKLETAKSLVTSQTLFATLEQLEDVVDDNGF